MPPHASPKSPRGGGLQLGRARRVVGHHAVDQARFQAAPQRLPVGRVPDRRAALELGGAVRHLLGREVQVVRAGLGGQLDARGLRARRSWPRIRPRTGGRCAPAPAGRGCGRDHLLVARRPRAAAGKRRTSRVAAGRRLDFGRVLRVHDQQRAEAASAPSRPAGRRFQRRELGDPRVDQEALNPITPASCSSASASMLPGTAPPQNPTSTRAGRPRRPAFGQRRGRRRRRQLFSGMSTSVVTPPAAAARVAVAKPSHSVRPGSLTCTWVSTRPGSSARSPRSTPRALSRVLSVTGDGGHGRPADGDGRGPRPVRQHGPARRTTRSYLIGLPAGARSHLQLKLAALAAGSDAWYSQPIQPS